LSDDDAETAWQGRIYEAAANFGFEIREATDTNPFGPDAHAPALKWMVGVFATELWDCGFSQSEIGEAFETALAKLGPYAAGEERRGDRLRGR
jgi:hypothetical protein